MDRVPGVCDSPRQIWPTRRSMLTLVGGLSYAQKKFENVFESDGGPPSLSRFLISVRSDLEVRCG